VLAPATRGLGEARFELARVRAEAEARAGSGARRVTELEAQVTECRAEGERQRLAGEALGRELHELKMRHLAESEELASQVAAAEATARGARQEAEVQAREVARLEEQGRGLQLRLRQKSSLEAQVEQHLQQQAAEAQQQARREEDQRELEAELKAIATQIGPLRRERDEARAAERHYKQELQQLTTELHAAQTEAAVAGARFQESQRLAEYVRGSQSYATASPSLPLRSVSPHGGGGKPLLAASYGRIREMYEEHNREVAAINGIIGAVPGDEREMPSVGMLITPGSTTPSAPQLYA
jgi:chromosome segregation ATPase